jgi:hypothetical protein
MEAKMAIDWVAARALKMVQGWEGMRAPGWEEGMAARTAPDWVAARAPKMVRRLERERVAY